MEPANPSFQCFSTNTTLQLNTVCAMISPQVPERQMSSWGEFLTLTQVFHMFCSFRIASQFMEEVILWDFSMFQNGSTMAKKHNRCNAGYNENREGKIQEVFIPCVSHWASTALKRNVASSVAFHFPLLSSWNNFPSSIKRQNFRFKVRELCADLQSLCKCLLMGRYDPGNNQYFFLLSQVHRAPLKH